MRMPWPKKVLIKKIGEILKDGVTYVLIVLAFLLWRFAFGNKFKWVEISPLAPPSIFIRSFYSAFTFLTLGALLYVAKFYKVLHDILVKGFGLWGLYNAVKAVVWLILMFISYEYVVPAIFAVFNTSATILYNVMAIVLYVAPPLGIAIILIAAYGLIKYKWLSAKS